VRKPAAAELTPGEQHIRNLEQKHGQQCTSEPVRAADSQHRSAGYFRTTGGPARLRAGQDKSAAALARRGVAGASMTQAPKIDLESLLDALSERIAEKLKPDEGKRQ
jgi:hypothetical protein